MIEWTVTITPILYEPWFKLMYHPNLLAVSSKISRALNAIWFMCTYRNTAHSKVKYCILPYACVGLASAHLLEWGTDTKLEYGSLTSRRNDLQTSYRMSKVPENSLFKTLKSFWLTWEEISGLLHPLQSYGFPILPETFQNRDSNSDNWF